MTQHQITHIAGELPPCSGCRREPKHYHDRRAARVNGGHFLECAPCDRRTGRHPSLKPAIAEWHRINGTAPARPAAIDSRVQSIR
jgi:hypothetical protein